MTRNELYNIMQRSNKATFDEKLDYMQQEILSHYSEHDKIVEAKKKLSVIKHQFKEKWLAVRKTKSLFEKKNVEWLKGIVSLPIAGRSIIKYI